MGKLNTTDVCIERFRKIFSKLSDKTYNSTPAHRMIVRNIINHGKATVIINGLALSHEKWGFPYFINMDESFTLCAAFLENCSRLRISPTH